MQIAEEWLKTWICLSFLFTWARAARPRFDVSTDMGMVLVPADAEVDTAIFRLRATDQDADFPLVFEIIVTTAPVVRIENLPCTLYNKVCQANVILTRRLVAGRLHDFVVRVRDSKGDVNSMQATISVTNATTPRDKIFPHLPSLIMVPEDTKPEKELDYLLVESNPWSGKPVYIELWQPKELFNIRQKQMGSRTKGIITLIGDLDFETQSMYTLTMYATDPYTEPGKDTRNIAGVHVVVIVQDVQDVPPVFTLAPPLTKINNTVKPGDVILRVHAEDGDKGVPREVTYGLISEGNPFTTFFNVSETTGEIILAKPLEELTQITHVGAPIVLRIVAEEIRNSRDEPPAQASIVELGLLLGEPGNNPPYFENDNYIAWMDENAEPGTTISFTDAYSTIVRDEDIGKAGVFALILENNNNTFEISPAVAERTAHFIITVRDNLLIDYEKFKSLRFRIVAQEVGPATNLSTSVPVTIFLRDINDNAPVFDMPVYEVTIPENPSAGSRVLQVHAADNDTGIFGKILYTKIYGTRNEAFELNPENGVITISSGSILDREETSRLELSVEARDEDGRGLRGFTTLIVNILDVNDNAPIFERGTYEFLLNSELTNFTMSAIIKAIDADAEPPNNVVRYEIIHGNYDNKFQLNEETGELTLREAINKVRKARQAQPSNSTLNLRKQFRKANLESLENDTETTEIMSTTTESTFRDFHLINNLTDLDLDAQNQSRRRRAEDTPLFILTARAYDLGVPHLSNTAQIRIMRPMSAFARIVTFLMPGDNPDPTKTAETLATITGSRVVIRDIKPYITQNEPGITADMGKRSVVVAQVEHGLPGTVVDIDKIRETLAANGFGIISGMDNIGSDNIARPNIETTPADTNSAKYNSENPSSIEEVTVYKTENKLLTWLLILLGLLLLAALITLIACCTCPSCPFYMEPRKRRIHSSETLVIRTDGRPKRHLHRKPIKIIDGYSSERKEAWSADPARQQWYFNRRNMKNPGIASLPGDVISGYQHPEVERQRHPASLRGVDPGIYGDRMPPNRAVDDERIYMEDVEAQNRHYEQTEIDSLRRHELERGSDAALRDEALAARQGVREQHFYREGNAEVLRLITRGEIEDRKDFKDRAKNTYQANGKDILLQRFIEDQKLRRNQDLRDGYHESYQEDTLDRSMESHRRANDQQEILILPERLEIQQQPSYRQQEQMRLIAERNYEYKGFKVIDDDEYRSRGIQRLSVRDADTLAGETSRSGEITSRRDRNATYSMHDAELVRQNALLTRLLLEKETRNLNVPVVDSSSFLETQSLPGHVATATQTDRTAATQTEFFGRSRSDNEESEEDPRTRRKYKLKGRLETKEDFKKMKTIWVRTPIPEESRAQSATKKTPTRTKIEVMESKKISISPNAMKEITHSLKSGESDGNEEDKDEEMLNQKVEPELDKNKKLQKIMSKTICTSKKKVNEARVDNDSTTPSPESKEKQILNKTKTRKKPEKPPRAKKPDKNADSEKKNIIEPSFRVLEREISNIHHKIREFGDKKLKMLKQEDNNKKDSEDDSGATYDISKKCEVTVKRTKKNVSREPSPMKIPVEHKTKTGKEDVYATVTKTTAKDMQQNTSSSDFEDYKNVREQPPSYNGKTQFEVSKLQTRSRSELKRQTHVENSDAKSSSDKNERFEDSESKTEMSKESSSSPDVKVDSNSSTSKDSTSSTSKDSNKQSKQVDNEKLKKPISQDKKSLQSQKVIKRTIRPNGIDLKRKNVPAKSKTIDDSMKRIIKKEESSNRAKSMTSPNDKITSPSKNKESIRYEKLMSSEENESHPKHHPSPVKEIYAIDLDKLAQDVRGVVEKEIFSLTQAAKDALYVNKLEQTSSDTKDEKLESPSRHKDMKKSMHTTVENKSQSQSTIEKLKMTKSMENKEKRENIKYQKFKSKSAESTSSKMKTDEAISFIVFENDKIAPDSSGYVQNFENQASKKLENHANGFDDKNDTKLTLKESDSKILDSKFRKMPEKMDNITKIEKSVSDAVQKTEKIIQDKIDSIKKGNDDTIETKNVVDNKIVETINRNDNKIDEIINIVDTETDTSTNVVENKIHETKNILPNNTFENKEIISDKIDDIKESLSDKIVEINKSTSDKIDETKNVIFDKIDESEKIVVDKIQIIEKIVADKTDEIGKIVTDKIDKTKNVIDNKTDEIEETVNNKIDETKKVATDKIDETVKNVIDATDKTKTLSYEIDKTINETHDTVENKLKTLSEEKEILLTDVKNCSDNLSKPVIENKVNIYEINHEDVESDTHASLPVCSSNDIKKDDALVSEIHTKICQEPKNEEKILSESSEMEASKNVASTIDIYKETEAITTIIDHQKEKTQAESLNDTHEKIEVEATQVRETNINILEEHLSTKNSITSNDLDKSEEAPSTDITPSTEIIKIEERKLERTFEDKLVSPCDKNKLPETSIEVAQPETQGQTITTEIESPKDTVQNKLDLSNSESKVISPEIKENEKTDTPSSQTNIHLETPILEITNDVDAKEQKWTGEEDESEDDSSSASDVSNKTALHTQRSDTSPTFVSTNRENETKEASDPGKLSVDTSKPRQKWSSTRENTGDQCSSQSLLFPRKIEVRPIDTPDKPELEPEKGKSQKSPDRARHADDAKPAETAEHKKSKPVVVGVKRKEHLRTEHYSHYVETTRSYSPRRESTGAMDQSSKSNCSTSEQRRVEVRSRHLKVSQHCPARADKSPSKSPRPASKEASPARDLKLPETHGREPEIANARSRYMAWYQQKRIEMEHKRRERKEAEEELARGRGAKKPPAGGKLRKAKSAEDELEENGAVSQKTREHSKSTADTSESSTARGRPRISRLRIRPLVNVESEQLKAIVRQGRKLLKAEGWHPKDPPVQIFVPELPPRDHLAARLQVPPRHHLTQHSEYQYEKILPAPAPFYLHPPPPPPHPSPEHLHDDSSESRRLDDDLDSGIAVSLQGGTRLRHQQLLEKKSVFDIAYSEAAPAQLRSDSSTPPS